MTVNKTSNGTSYTLFIDGRLDTTTAPELESEIKALPAEMTELILDFEKLEYLSSAGLRVLLAAHTDMSSRGRMAVKNANKIITDILEVTGFSDILNFI